ncbi:MAG: hypothetical protein ACKV2V_29640 [Blastocatellia bacterium]
MFSFVSLDRMAEREAAKNPIFRERTAGRARRSGAVPLDDDALVARLQEHGISMDRDTLRTMIEHALSAEEIAKPILKSRRYKSREEELQAEWIWVCIEALWHRWIPEIPSFEMLDDKMQAGYDLTPADPVGACRVWMEALGDFNALMARSGLQTLKAFDGRFQGTQYVHNWLSDL